MTLEEIMQLDCRKEENERIIQKELKNIGPLKKYSEDEKVPYDMIEKVIVVLGKKYNLRIREFQPDVMSNKDCWIWKSIIIDDEKLKTIGIIYGISTYEILAKAAIFMYHEKDSVGRRGQY